MMYTRLQKYLVSTMMFRLFLLFTIVPAIELFLLFRVSEYIGSVETVVLIILTGILGSHMARQEGGAVLKKLLTEVQSGRSPAKEIVEGVMILAGGLLLVTPGVVTDLVGFSFIIPFTRKFLVTPILEFALRKMSVDANGSVHKNMFDGFVDIGPISTPSQNNQSKQANETHTKEKQATNTQEDISIIVDKNTRPQTNKTNKNTGPSKFKNKTKWSHPIADE